MADENKTAYASREWHTGDVITADALNKIENEMEYVSAEVTNAVTGTINDQKLNDTIARKLDSIVKYFPEEPTEENLENVRLYVQPAEDNGEITVPTIDDYETFKTNFVQPYTNKAYAVGDYVEYGDVIYKVISAITKNGNLTDDEAWAALIAQTPSPVISIDVMKELNNLISVYTSDSQLTNEQNRIWIQQPGESVEVPTYEEFTSLSNSVDDLKSAVTESTKNLFDIYAVPAKDGITNSGGVLSGTASAFASGYGNSTDGIAAGTAFESNTRYTFSMMVKNRTGSTGSGIIIRFVYTDSTNSQNSVSNTTTTYTAFSVTSEASKTISKIVVSYASEGALVWDLKDIQIEKGTTATGFVGHLTAVDTQARSEINDYENIVNNQLSLMNSVNLFKKAKTQTKYDNSLTYTSNGDGFITLNGTYANEGYFDIATMTDLGITAGNDYYINYGSPSKAISYLVVYANTGSGFAAIYTELCGINKIHIPEGTTDVLLRLYTKGGQSFSNTKYRLTVSEALSNADLVKPSAQMYFLDAWGTGDCTIVKFADGTTLVIDFGFAEEQHTLHRSWINAVAALGVTHIDYGIISHYHEDHIGLLIDTNTTHKNYVDISQYIDANTTFFLPNGHPYTTAELETLAWIDTMESSSYVVQNYNDVMNKLDTLQCKIVYPAENEVFNIGGCQVQFLNANQTWIMDKFSNHDTFDYNEASLCNYITIGSQRICFSGDIGELAMDKYKTSVLQSQIFKVNHHCMGYGVVPLFLNSLMPELCVSMVGHGLAVNRLGTNQMQKWCEDNFVPNVVTGINEHNVAIYMDDGGYKFINSCRKLICEDEGISTTTANEETTGA